MCVSAEGSGIGDKLEIFFLFLAVDSALCFHKGPSRWDLVT